MDTGPDTANYEAVLNDMIARRDKLNAAIEAIRGMLGISAESAAADGSMPKGVPAPVSISTDSFFKMSIPDATIKFLKMARKPQSTREIADALERGGMTHTSQDFTQTVGSVINRRSQAIDSEIVNVKRGVWGLAEWYPGLKRTRRAGQEKGESEQPQEPQ